MIQLFKWISIDRDLNKRGLISLYSLRSLKSVGRYRMVLVISICEYIHRLSDNLSTIRTALEHPRALSRAQCRSMTVAILKCNFQVEAFNLKMQERETIPDFMSLGPSPSNYLQKFFIFPSIQAVGDNLVFNLGIVPVCWALKRL